MSGEHLDFSENRPYFEGIFGLTGHPLRHIFMAGTVWRLAGERPGAAIRVLEIGAWCGASALTWAHAIARFGDAGGEVTCVDPWNPYHDLSATTHDHAAAMESALARDEPFRVFRHNIGFAPPGVKIRYVRASSADALPALSGTQFDIVYVDGDHAYAAIKTDLDLARSLTATGGVICGDDLEQQADEVNSEIVEQLPGIDQHADPASGIYFHPGVTRAVGEMFGRVAAWHGYWAMRKVEGGWEPLSLRGMPIFVPPHLRPAAVLELKSDLLELGNLA